MIGAGATADADADDGDTVSWRALLARTEERLAGAGLTAPGVDARRILEEASGLGGAEWVLHADEQATVGAVEAVDRMAGRRAAGEPLQYVLGHWSFRSLELLVDRRVLIPRPETEVVCEVALAELDRATSGATAGHPPRAVDLGTGSGALALAIAVERPGTEVWAVERSPDALLVARANLSAYERVAHNVRLLEGSWFEPLPLALRGAVDLLVSNPPYVGAHEPLPDDVADWEPAEALVPGPSGLEAVAAILAEAPVWLAPHGSIVLEIGETQGPEAAALASAAGFDRVDVRPDLAGRPRVLLASA